MPAWTKAETTVSPDLRIDTGPPIAVGSAASTALANLRRLSLSLGSPFGKASTRIKPSLAFQELTIIRRQILQRDRLRLQEILELLEHDLQRIDEDRLRLVAGGLIGIGELLQRVREPARGDRARSLVLARGGAQGIHRALQRIDVFLIRRRIVDRIPD